MFISTTRQTWNSIITVYVEDCLIMGDKQAIDNIKEELKKYFVIEIEDKITIQPNWETSTDRDIEFTRTYSRKFYDYAVKRVVNEVRASRTQSIKERLKLRTKSLAALSLMKFYKSNLLRF